MHEAQKSVSSTSGMENSLRTSQLSQYRIAHCVEQNLEQLRRALACKDFSQLAAVTMRESNQLHAICLDSAPAIVYLNAASFLIIEFVHVVNEVCGKATVAYTFDAGPNAFLICEHASEMLVRRLLDFSFDTDVAGAAGEESCFGVDEDQLRVGFAVYMGHEFPWRYGGGFG